MEYVTNFDHNKFGTWYWLKNRWNNIQTQAYQKQTPINKWAQISAKQSF